MVISELLALASRLQRRYKLKTDPLVVSGKTLLLKYIEQAPLSSPTQHALASAVMFSDRQTLDLVLDTTLATIFPGHAALSLVNGQVNLGVRVSVNSSQERGNIVESPLVMPVMPYALQLEAMRAFLSLPDSVHETDARGLIALAKLMTLG